MKKSVQSWKRVGYQLSKVLGKGKGKEIMIEGVNFSEARILGLEWKQSEKKVAKECTIQCKLINRFMTPGCGWYFW